MSSRDRLASSLSINGGGAPPQPGEEVDEPVAAPAAAAASADAPDEPAAAPAAAPADEGAAKREPPRKNRSYFD